VTITLEGGRVLGCLVEKQLTTPQQYPLTMNALSLACTQTTNREPVMTMDEGAVAQALQELKELHLVRFVLPSHGKSVVRYRHVLDEAYGLDTARLALVAVLLLRGPQTPGELRSRTARMAEFDSLDAMQQDLEILAGRPESLVVQLHRRPGQKEDRWRQLVAAEPNGPGSTGASEEEIPVGTDSPPPSALHLGATGSGVSTPSTGTEGGPDDLEHRVDDLRSEVAGLRDELARLTASLDALRSSLGE
jgi:uncharacterized protein YceH (UPF0502 family)